MPNKLSAHDRLTRSLMSHPKVAAEFFEQNLPENVKNALDFSSLKLKQDSFIDDGLKLQEADLLYAVNFNGEPGFLYLLFEHASSPQKLLPFRLLKYMIAIMEKHQKEHKTEILPLIYPIILYNGKKPYMYSMDLFDLFPVGEKELAKEALTSPYHLIDLTQVPDEELQKCLYFGTMAITLKHIRDSDIYPIFNIIISQMLKELDKRGESSYIYTVMTYVTEAGKTEHPHEMIQTIKALSFLDEEKIMGTLAEYWKPQILKMATDKVMAEVAEKACHEQAVETAKTLLLQGIDLNIISTATKLSKEEIKKLSHVRKSPSVNREGM